MARTIPSFEIIERAPGCYSVLGDVDVATAPQLRQLEDQHGLLALDLHGVTFIDSTGVAALLDLRNRCDHDGSPFTIEAASETVERVLQLVGLHDLLLGSMVVTTEPTGLTPGR